MDPEIKALLQRRDLPTPDGDLLDGEPPEPVDVTRIRAMLAGELDRPEEFLVGHLMANYRAWYDAALDEMKSRP